MRATKKALNDVKIKFDGNSKPINIDKINKKAFTSSKIYIRRSNIKKAGFGVFAKKNIEKHEVIELSPFTEEEVCTDFTRKYAFCLPSKERVNAISLGYGSLFNHSENFNASWLFDDQLKRLMLFYATRDINKNDEIYIHYGDNHMIHTLIENNKKKDEINNKL